MTFLGSLVGTDILGLFTLVYRSGRTFVRYLRYRKESDHSGLACYHYPS